MEKKEREYEQLAASDVILAILPWLGIFFVVKYFRNKGTMGKLYIAFAIVYTIGVTVSIYLYLK